MLELQIETLAPELSQVQVTRLPYRIGRGRDNDLVLRGWRVAKAHAQIEWCDGRYRLRPLGSHGPVLVNEAPVTARSALAEGDLIRIGGHALIVARCGRFEPDGACAGTQSSRSVTVQMPASTAMADRAAIVDVGADTAAIGVSDSRGRAAGSASEQLDELAQFRADFVGQRRALHRSLLETIDLRRNDVRQLSAPQLRDEVRTVLTAIVAADPLLAGTPQAAELVEAVLDEAVGFGPLEALLADPEVTEIMVNGAHDIFCERRGRIEHSEACFSSEQSVRAVIERIVAPVGRRVDESAPMVDARLPDGSRVNAVLPPLAIRGPSITIRKFNRRLLTPRDLLGTETLDIAMMAFLEICVRHRRSIAVSGGTGSGKTTLLNVLACLIPPGERIVTIEDAAELSLPHRNLVALEARPANAEGRGSVVIRDLVRNSLRMRPDRIVVGECRGGEALDMLQAMNTGHDGSLTTLHANSVRDALARLETMALMAGIELPAQAIREQIAAAVNIVVHQARLSDGRRRIVEIAEITGIEGARIQTQTLFRGRARGGGSDRAKSRTGGAVAAGASAQVASTQVASTQSGPTQGGWIFEPCGVVPRFYESLVAAGCALDMSIFSPPADALAQRKHDAAAH